MKITFCGPFIGMCFLCIYLKTLRKCIFTFLKTAIISRNMKRVHPSALQLSRRARFNYLYYYYNYHYT
jgi:hypothetical protein